MQFYGVNNRLAVHKFWSIATSIICVNVGITCASQDQVEQNTGSKNIVSVAKGDIESLKQVVQRFVSDNILDKSLVLVSNTNVGSRPFRKVVCVSSDGDRRSLYTIPPLKDKATGDLLEIWDESLLLKSGTWINASSANLRTDEKTFSDKLFAGSMSGGLDWYDQRRILTSDLLAGIVWSGSRNIDWMSPGFWKEHPAEIEGDFSLVVRIADDCKIVFTIVKDSSGHVQLSEWDVSYPDSPAAKDSKSSEIMHDKIIVHYGEDSRIVSLIRQYRLRRGTIVQELTEKNEVQLLPGADDKIEGLRFLDVPPNRSVRVKEDPESKYVFRNGELIKQLDDKATD